VLVVEASASRSSSIVLASSVTVPGTEGVTLALASVTGLSVVV
jgi:hypothetical protein